ncbi:hypothetical protein CBR_g3343 [Chara braunii]|uniref:Uncharacterized protein n=1 Tax=Chara braunii TaxID=69332 RepID=A0A388KFQ9_CHABU|nr:hypothetical protein CBR_g3343 [Chara braunii]|eukprot:GBG68803.1 hypothetical protein CBR_g3343 [Chara braunii]
MTMATVIMVKGTSPVEMRIKAAAYDGQDITRGVRSAAVDVSCLTRIEGKTEGWKGVLPDAAFNFDKRRTAARVCKSTANFGVTVPSVRRSSLHGIIGIGNPCNTALLRRCRRSGTMDQRLQRRQTTWPAAPVVRAVDLHLDGKGDQEHHQAPLHSHIGLGSSSLESSEGLLANTFSEHFVPAQQPLGQMRASTSSSSSSSSSSSYCSYAYDPNSGAAMSTNSNTAVIATDAINTVSLPRVPTDFRSPLSFGRSQLHMCSLPSPRS